MQYLCNMSIKNKVNITRKQRHNALIDHLGMIAEVILHSLSAVDGIDHNAILHDNGISLLNDTDDVVSAVLALLYSAGNADISLLEIKIAKSALKALIKK